MKNINSQLTKATILLVISLGLLWFSGQFSPATLFEPQSTGWTLWVSYAKDLILPFAFYFFLCLGERWLKTWQARALLAFAIPALIEFGQALYQWGLASRYFAGHYVGSFDLVDIFMYAVGVGLAVLVEQRILAKLFTPDHNKGITLHA
jgi:glycopeptide antibiotics resistance protein